MVSIAAKLLSLLLAAITLLVSWRVRTADASASLSLTVVSLAPIFVFFGLLAVWLARPFASFTGPVFRGGYVESPTPEIGFVVFGYLLLALPLGALLFHVCHAAAPTL